MRLWSHMQKYLPQRRLVGYFIDPCNKILHCDVLRGAMLRPLGLYIGGGVKERGGSITPLGAGPTPQSCFILGPALCEAFRLAL